MVCSIWFLTGQPAQPAKRPALITMLPPEIIKKIKKVHIRTGRTVNTLMAGQYKSVFRGMGMEFEEVREYAPGDDV